jgi:hypothetical protein
MCGGSWCFDLSMLGFGRGWPKIASFDRVLELLYVELEDMILGILHLLEPSKPTVGSLSILRVNKQRLKAGGDILFRDNRFLFTCSASLTGFIEKMRGGQMGEFLGRIARFEVRLAQDFFPLERSLHTTFSLASGLQKLRTLDVHLIGWKSGAYGFSDGASDWERKIREYHSTPWKLGNLTSITMTGVGDDVEKEVFEELLKAKDRKLVILGTSGHVVTEEFGERGLEKALL